MLLVFDNFEHLLAAVPLVTEFLRACPSRKVLATSRRRLGLSGEHEVPVPPLAVADPHQSLTVDQLAAVPAIQLFVARASGRSQLCAYRGERAAGRRDLPEVGWIAASHRARRAANAAPLTGGLAVAAYEPPTPPSVLDLVTALVDESLVQITQQADGERRFGMLETVREYALERLHQAGEEASARRLHAEYCLRLVERADSGQYMPKDWLDRQLAEHDNHRAALTWSVAQEPEMALRLADALGRFWSQRGYWSEGRGWLEQALTAALDAPPALRASALAAAGMLADDQGDFLYARRSFEGSLELA